MFCTNCGKELPDGGRFCAYCGTQVAAAFGAAAPAAPQGAYTAPVQNQNYYQPTGQMIMDAGKVVVYNGTKAIGVTYGDGTLYVFDDRLEFYKKHGTMAGMGVNPVVGMAVSAADAKKNPVDTWYYRDMAEVFTGKHAGVISKICIKFRSGKGFSVTLSGHGNNTNSMVENLCATINQYL